MIHSLPYNLCAIKHDTNLESIIKAKYASNHLQLFSLKNSLLSCYIRMGDVINDFLKKSIYIFIIISKSG